MVLYTCFLGTSLGGVPGPLGHPCGKAGTVIAGSGNIATWAKANPAAAPAASA